MTTSGYSTRCDSPGSPNADDAHAALARAEEERELAGEDEDFRSEAIGRFLITR